jgi:hypothetical protein
MESAGALPHRWLAETDVVEIVAKVSIRFNKLAF